MGNFFAFFDYTQHPVRFILMILATWALGWTVAEVTVRRRRSKQK